MSAERDEHRESVAAYLLGALAELEATAFERHVMRCASCRDELEHLRPAAEALPRSVTPVAPRPALKRSIMEVVREEARGHAARPALLPRLRLRMPGALRELRPAMAWVSAAVLVGVGAIAGYGATRLGEDEGARTVTAVVDEARVPGAGASLIVAGDPSEGAILSVHGLGETAGDRVYVVWLARGDEVIFESSFNVRPDGSGKAAIESLAGVDRVMVTRERSAAVTAPSEPPILTAETS